MAAQLVLMVFSVKQAEITNVFEAMRVFSGRDLRKLLIPLIIEQVLMSFMGMADTMMAVSYTHLDVYKRQVSALFRYDGYPPLK